MSVRRSAGGDGGGSGNPAGFPAGNLEEQQLVIDRWSGGGHVGVAANSTGEDTDLDIGGSGRRVYSAHVVWERMSGADGVGGGGTFDIFTTDCRTDERSVLP